jgi:hypothetical protein
MPCMFPEIKNSYVCNSGLAFCTRERVKRRFISNVCAGNATLCYEHHVARALQVELACFNLMHMV